MFHVWETSVNPLSNNGKGALKEVISHSGTLVKDWQITPLIRRHVKLFLSHVNELLTKGQPSFPTAVLRLLGWSFNRGSTNNGGEWGPRLISYTHWVNTYLWGMPMTKLSTPKELEESMMVFMQGMRTSQPSKPNRFSDDHFLARNSSNLKQQVNVLTSVPLEAVSVSQCPIGPHGHWLCSDDVYRIFAIFQRHLFKCKGFPFG